MEEKDKTDFLQTVKDHEEVSMPAKEVFTDNQKIILDILSREFGEYTASEISEISGGRISSRGVGSAVRKLIQLNKVEKIEGRPVRYVGIRSHE